MVNRTAAGYAAQWPDLLSCRQSRIDFLKGVLVIADNYRRLVDVKEHILMAGIQVALAVLFQGQINCGIGNVMVVD